MIDPEDELKTRATILHKRIAAGDAAALSRLRALPEHAKADDAALRAVAPEIQRKQCLTVVAREYGFTSWVHALRVLRGDEAEADFGTLLYDTPLFGTNVRGTLNVWFANHDEARGHLKEARSHGSDRYLLAFRRQFFIVERQFIQDLGWDPSDPDWEKLGFDWARPEDASARRRLYGKLLQALRADGGSGAHGEG